MSLACSAAPTDSRLSVQVMPGLELSSPADAAAALERAWRAPYMLRPGALAHRRIRKLERCADLGGVRLRDVAVFNDADVYALQKQMIECHVLRMLTRAQPSRVSYIREVLTESSPGKVLPAALAAAFSDEEADRVAKAQLAGRAWSDVDKSLKFEVGERAQRWRELDVRGDVSGYLQWWATGDFNGDGSEDLIVFRSVGPSNGSAVDVTAFLLTRTRPGGVLELLERIK